MDHFLLSVLLCFDADYGSELAPDQEDQQGLQVFDESICLKPSVGQF